MSMAILVGRRSDVCGRRCDESPRLHRQMIVRNDGGYKVRDSAQTLCPHSRLPLTLLRTPAMVAAEVSTAPSTPASINGAKGKPKGRAALRRAKEKAKRAARASETPSVVSESDNEVRSRLSRRSSSLFMLSRIEHCDRHRGQGGAVYASELVPRLGRTARRGAKRIQRRLCQIRDRPRCKGALLSLRSAGVTLTVVQPEIAAVKGEVIYSDEEASSAGDSDAEAAAPVMSKRKLRKINRLSVAELKRLVKKPEVVEWVDVTAADPRMLVQLKSYRNTIPVPAHWSQKRDYLQGKRGIEKPLYQLPGASAIFRSPSLPND